MVDRGTDDRQSEGDVNGPSETVVLQNRKPLIVVHREDRIGVGEVSFGECGVGRQWSDQPQPFALLMPSPLAVEALGTAEGRAAFEDELAALLDGVNATLDPHEQLAFAVVVADGWSIENALLTPTMKIRRSAIEARYAERIDDWAAQGQRVVWEADLLATA